MFPSIVFFIFGLKGGLSRAFNRLIISEKEIARLFIDTALLISVILPILG